MDENYDGIPKFYNENLLSEQWLLSMIVKMIGEK